MTKFFDSKNLAFVRMTDNNTGIDFENDFFEVGGLEYNADLDAYKVNDVYYLAEYMCDYVNGKSSDFDYPIDSDGDMILPDVATGFEAFELWQFQK